MTDFPRQRSRICNFFKNGRCNRGASCRFSHDLESTEPAQEVAPRGQGRAPPRSPLHIRLRTWKFDIPQSRELAEPLNITELQAFFSTAWDLVTSGEVDILHQTVDALASDGGLTRINEAATTIAAGHSDRQCLQYGEKILLPLVKVFAHPSLTQSFILEKPMGIIHNFLYGLGGSRAVALFSSASRFFSLFKAQPAERLSAVFAVLTCLRNIVELNSSAKVVQEIHDVVVDLADILEEDLAQSYEARRLFQRIKDRLDEGSAMPNAHARQSKPSYLSQFPALNLERDQPGQLSPQGPRHDNDHEDVSLISILPTASEVQSQRAEYLPVRDPRSLHLGGTEGLIDRQFRLLREDTIGQLRDIVRAETESLRDPSSLALVPRNAQQRRFAYKNVELEQITFSRVGGLRAELSFSQPQAVAKKSELLRREWWEHSRRLCSDALLCLIDATHNVTFFTVCGEEPSGSREKGARSKLLYQDADRASVTIQLIEPHQLDIARLVGALPDTASHAHVLCEFPGVLLPSFYPTLKALQTMSTKLDLPFTEIIAPSDTRPEATAVEPPLYARKPGFKFDLRSIVKDEHLELSLGEGFDYTALAAKSSLDEAQQSAVIDALTRKLALVQGPPGTGKSFTGVSIIKVLLDNASKARLGPIICVCYTNHALDQLLEHLIEDDVEGIIRVGSRSKSELVKRLNLRDHVQAAERTPVEKYRYGTSKSAIELEAEEMKPLLEILSWPDNPQHVKNFLRTAFPLHYQQIYGIEEDEEGYQVTRYDRREAITRWLHPRGTRHHISDIVSRPKDRSVDQLKFADVRTMTLRERQKLYDHWTETLKNNVLTQLRPAFAEIREYVQELEQCRKEDDLRVLATAKVIGVTTSGLARNLDVLRRLHSKVLVCEEAGEVLEAHLLTALLPSVEHAILIGDHQQLKPQIANYDLSSENPRGVQYSLDISLFERLLLPNVPRAPAIPYSTLRTQRRMHPSIAHLIRSTLYPGLIDHESVKAYPKVEGMRDRLFWFHHDHPENSAERQDTTSHTNEYEVEIVVALVHHLVRQSTYNSEDIAVLTPYLGQLHKIRNKLASSFEIVVGERDQVDLEKEGFKPVLDNINQALMARKTSLSRAVRLATVDNFQVGVAISSSESI